jgi:hypothetical protein
MNYREFLVRLADTLDSEGRSDLANKIDEDFEEFVKLLEEGKLDFDFTFFGKRDPRLPYSNRGRELPLHGVPGPQ